MYINKPGTCKEELAIASASLTLAKNTTSCSKVLQFVAVNSQIHDTTVVLQRSIT